MIRFDIISCVPELLRSPFNHSILKRAIDNGLMEVEVHDLRQHGFGRHKQIDDYQYGGGAGMVLMIEPISKLIKELVSTRSYDEIIYLTPDGDQYHQATANKLSLSQNLLIICGHYKGIDQRVRDKYVTMEISIGDYVISGGELAAAVLVDSIGRLIPGVLSDGTSALSDSHQDGLLAPPIYTRPAKFEHMKVPEILLSGHEAKINQWRNEKAFEKTKNQRPDLLNE